jgi:hypothetical protein
MKLVVTTLDVIVIILACCLFISSLYIAPLRRTFIGQTSRWVLGESRGKQIPNDLAEDIEKNIPIAELQDWACNLMEMYTDCTLPMEIATARYVTVNSSIIPPALVNLFPKNRTPRVEIILSDSHQPEYVNVGSGLSGVCVGATNYVLKFEVYYSRKIADGIYTYFKDRK